MTEPLPILEMPFFWIMIIIFGLFLGLSLIAQEGWKFGEVFMLYVAIGIIATILIHIPQIAEWSNEQTNSFLIKLFY